MFNQFPIILLASGNSIPFSDNKLDLKLKEIIQNNLSFGLNYFWKWGCSTTLNTFVDSKYYQTNFDDLSKLFLILGINHGDLKVVQENTILFPRAKYFFGEESWDYKNKKCMTCGYKCLKDSKQKSCHTCHSFLTPIGFNYKLCGVFSLTLAIALGFKIIYLLGYDGIAINGKTHFYQDLVENQPKYNKGVGFKEINKIKRYKTSDYNNIKKINEETFAPYKNLQGVQIFNVSPESAINIFPKIDYSTFYQLIGTEKINQEVVRKEIKENILAKIK